MRIAIAGGTGVVGRHVVEATRAAGHHPVVLGRSSGVDVASGAGLRDALDGCSTVIDVSGPSSLRRSEAVRFFAAAGRNLQAAEREAGVGHHVALSIVGAADVDDGYYAGKARQERILHASPNGWTLLRTTQFHEFSQQIAVRGDVAGVVLAPLLRCQPVAAAQVAQELVRLALGEPRGLVPDLAGPHEEFLPDMVRRWIRVAGRRAPVLGIPLPGRIGRAMRDGALLPGADARRGSLTFADWLAAESDRADE